ncbi:MAG: response regulator, partial [Comamonadaceae bacterium]
ACSATTEKDAVAWLETHRDGWDLAIVDLFLLQGNGFGVIKACRERRAHQKVVVLSNYATLDMRERSRALGADAFFDKSAELELLLAWCEQQMGSGAQAH